uniref:Uncharacterized protein n=1 Tax=Moniliophthora roreri TaxID=221103 RepID=A0A0W0G0H7_MONRR
MPVSISGPEPTPKRPKGWVDRGQKARSAGASSRIQTRSSTRQIYL